MRCFSLLMKKEKLAHKIIVKANRKLALLLRQSKNKIKNLSVNFLFFFVFTDFIFF